ncbi:MAG: DNA helicase PcrA [Armatimonadota bacterium]|nr:DNA helicase PcrA [Armatimonadota bacterium]
MDILKELNEPQREAVEHTEGPALVFAGAGSGKTRVLTYRIAYLIEAKNVSPRNILAVTFTNKAAQEMKNRIETLIGSLSRQVWAGTFHSICARILRIDGDKIGIDPEYIIFDDADQISQIKECLQDLGLSDKKYHPREVLNHISKAKEQLITPDEYTGHFAGQSNSVIARIYALYRKKLKENRALDFDDLIMEAVRLFRESPATLESYHQRLQYLLVDEYQDINYAQYVFIRTLASKHRNIFCVGDDDQSIYRWRGADVGIILQFERDYPDAKIVKLEQNYRSTKNILDAAYEVVRRNISRREKELWTEKPQGDAISVHETANEQEEAALVADKILHAVSNRRFSDFAVLYRMNSQSRSLEEAFINRKIPYKLVGSVRFYERKEIKDVIAYLRLAYNPFETISLRRVINNPSRGIGPTTLSKLEDFAAERGIPLFEAVRRAEEIEEILPKAKRALNVFAKFILFLHESREHYGVSRLTVEVLENTGYVRSLLEEKSSDARSRVENVEELVSVTQQFDAESEEKSLSKFLETVALMSDIDSYDEAGNAVTLMTLHSAKGLEFDVVYMVGMEEGIFPHSRSMNDPEEMEEERRLCYVGITRARDELHLTYAWQRMLQGMTKRASKSRFLRDIPADLLERRSTVTSAAQPLWRSTLETKRTRSTATFKPGTKVLHKQFGKGIVLNSTGSGEEEQVTVAFEAGFGVKKLLLIYAGLEKV